MLNRTFQSMTPFDPLYCMNVYVKNDILHYASDYYTPNVNYFFFSKLLYINKKVYTHNDLKDKTFRVHFQLVVDEDDDIYEAQCRREYKNAMYKLPSEPAVVPTERPANLNIITERHLGKIKKKKAKAKPTASTTKFKVVADVDEFLGDMENQVRII